MIWKTPTSNQLNAPLRGVCRIVTQQQHHLVNFCVGTGSQSLFIGLSFSPWTWLCTPGGLGHTSLCFKRYPKRLGFFRQHGNTTHPGEAGLSDQQPVSERRWIRRQLTRLFELIGDLSTVGSSCHSLDQFRDQNRRDRDGRWS